MGNNLLQTRLSASFTTQAVLHFGPCDIATSDMNIWCFQRPFHMVRARFHGPQVTSARLAGAKPVLQAVHSPKNASEHATKQQSLPRRSTQLVMGHSSSRRLPQLLVKQTKCVDIKFCHLALEELGWLTAVTNPVPLVGTARHWAF
eukprot:SAG31_NODE_1516_length_8036_cov_2.800680_6_plen_146_part_00